MSARRLPSLVLAAALAVASPVVVAAQPACAPGTVAEYLALVSGCRIDRVTFTDFGGVFGRNGFYGGTAPSLDGVTVTPVGSGDLVGFGVMFTPPLAVSTVTGTADGGPTFDFTFDVRGVGPGGTIGLAPIALFTAVVDATAAGSAHLGAGARIAVWSDPAGAAARAETTQYGAAPATYRCTVGGTTVPCGPLVSTSFAGGRAHARAEVAVQGIPSIPVSASLTSLNVLIGVPAAAPAPPTAVVPEPGAGALLASGLAALGVGSRRRRTLPKL